MAFTYDCHLHLMKVFLFKNKKHEKNKKKRRKVPIICMLILLSINLYRVYYIEYKLFDVISNRQISNCVSSIEITSIMTRSIVLIEIVKESSKRNQSIEKNVSIDKITLNRSIYKHTYDKYHDIDNWCLLKNKNRRIGIICNFPFLNN